MTPERRAEIKARIPTGDHPWRLEPRIVGYEGGQEERAEGFEIWTATEDGEFVVAEIHDEWAPDEDLGPSDDGTIVTAIDATHDVHPRAPAIAQFILHARNDMTWLLAEVDRLTAELAKAREDQEWLGYLEQAGIDNSPAYDYACQLRREARAAGPADAEETGKP